MVSLFVFIGFGLCASFICSMLEAVLLSVSSAFIAVSVKKGNRSGVILQRLKDRVDRPLAAILTLNTIANTFSAAGVGVQVLTIWGQHWVAFASGALTFTILIASEIIPKTLGVAKWKSLAPFAAYAIQTLIFLTYPIVLISEWISSFLRAEKDSHVTRDEIIETAEIGALQGRLRRKESLIIKNLLHLNRVPVTQVMTPLPQVFALESQTTVGMLMEKGRSIRFSRIPIYDGTIDRVVGIVLRHKILEAYSLDQDHFTMQKLANPISKISEDLSVAAALDQFILKREHLFAVINKNNQTVGLVTMEDAIETLLGVEIMDELDSVSDFRQFASEHVKRLQRARVNPPNITA